MLESPLEPAVLISIHALREEGDHDNRRTSQGTAISIHALREEGDLAAAVEPAQAQKFLSTPSARRATLERRNRVPLIDISIHALREEGDVWMLESL